jgi:hypothetical protein
VRITPFSYCSCADYTIIEAPELSSASLSLHSRSTRLSLLSRIPRSQSATSRQIYTHTTLPTPCIPSQSLPSPPPLPNSLLSRRMSTNTRRCLHRLTNPRPENAVTMKTPPPTPSLPSLPSPLLDKTRSVVDDYNMQQGGSRSVSRPRLKQRIYHPDGASANSHADAHSVPINLGLTRIVKMRMCMVCC